MALFDRLRRILTMPLPLPGHGTASTVRAAAWPCVAGVVVGAWAAILGVDSPMMYRFLYASPDSLRHEVWLLDFSLGIALYLLFRIFLARWAACLAACGLALAVAAISTAKMRILGRPLQVWDFWFAADVGQLARFVHIDILAWTVALPAAGWCVWWLAGRRRRIPVVRRPTLVSVVIGVGVLAAWVIAVGGGQVEGWSEAPIHVIAWDQGANYRNYGPYYTLVANASFLRVTEPSPLELQFVDTIDRIAHADAEAPETPDVVTVLSEAFTDLPPRLFRKPYSCLAGAPAARLVTPSWGGMTANVEFELFTGYPEALFPDGAIPYLMYLKRPLPHALPWQFARAGYDTSAIHTFERGFFARDKVYPRLGFTRFAGIEDLAGVSLRGQFADDHVLFEKIIEQLNAGTKPQFVHAVTMMAHQPYTYPGRYPPLAGLDAALPPPLAPFRVGMTLYASMMYDHERMFCAFLRKLDRRPRRTVVLFYGDHYPSFGTLDAYEAIHKVLEPKDHGPVDVLHRYADTPLYLYDTARGFVRLPERTPAYNLGTLLLGYLHLPRTGIWGLPHKELDQAIVPLGPVATARERPPPASKTEGTSPEFEMLRAHMHRHMLTR